MSSIYFLWSNYFLAVSLKFDKKYEEDPDQPSQQSHLQIHLQRGWGEAFESTERKWRILAPRPGPTNDHKLHFLFPTFQQHHPSLDHSNFRLLNCT